MSLTGQSQWLLMAITELIKYRPRSSSEDRRLIVEKMLSKLVFRQTFYPDFNENEANKRKALKS